MPTYCKIWGWISFDLSMNRTPRSCEILMFICLRKCQTMHWCHKVWLYMCWLLTSTMSTIKLWGVTALLGIFLETNNKVSLDLMLLFMIQSTIIQNVAFKIWVYKTYQFTDYRLNRVTKTRTFKYQMKLRSRLRKQQSTRWMPTSHIKVLTQLSNYERTIKNIRKTANISNEHNKLLTRCLDLSIDSLWLWRSDKISAPMRSESIKHLW